MREPIQEYFMKIAKQVATRSTCLDKHVGAVIVKDKQIVACGYNGAPAGVVSCMEDGCCFKESTQICLATHAEINALIKAGKEAKGGEIYVTLEPCFECAKALINAGIKQVYYCTDNNKPIVYSSEVYRLFDQAGVIVFQIGED